MAVEVAVVIHAANHITARQAEAVLQGIGRVEGARAQLLSVDDLREGSYEWTTLDRADAIVFGAPTFLGAVPAGFRRFKEASQRRPANRLWKDKLAAGFTCSGSLIENEQAGLAQLASIAAQHGMQWVGPEAGDDDADGVASLGQRVAEAALRSKIRGAC